MKRKRKYELLCKRILRWNTTKCSYKVRKRYLPLMYWTRDNTRKINSLFNFTICTYWKFINAHQWFHQYWKIILNISIWNIPKYRYQYRFRKKYWSQYQYSTWILQYFSVSISVFFAKLELEYSSNQLSSYKLQPNFCDFKIKFFKIKYKTLKI